MSADDSCEIPGGPPGGAVGCKRLQKVRIDGVNRQVGDSRRAEQLLPPLSKILSDDGNTLSDEEKHLAALWDVAKRIGHVNYGLQTAHAAKALAPLRLFAVSCNGTNVWLMAAFRILDRP